MDLYRYTPSRDHHINHRARQRCTHQTIPCLLLLNFFHTMAGRHAFAPPRVLAVLLSTLFLALVAGIPAGQAAAVAGGFEVVQPNSLASAMMMALIDEDNVMIIDKAENNGVNGAVLDGGKPIWGAVMRLDDYSMRGLDMTTNAFCASGALMGNGTWMVAGGNQPVGYGGALLMGIAPQDGPYQDLSGLQAIRLMEPSSDSANLAWIDNANTMASLRWYPGIEVMTDGSVLLIGGATGGGYINRNYPNVDPAYEGGGANPTWEFFPSKGNTPQVNNFMQLTSGAWPGEAGGARGGC